MHFVTRSNALALPGNKQRTLAFPPWQASYTFCAISLTQKPLDTAEASQGCRGMLLAQPGGMQTDGSQGKRRGGTSEVPHQVTCFDSPSQGSPNTRSRPPWPQTLPLVLGQS